MLKRNKIAIKLTEKKHHFILEGKYSFAKQKNCFFSTVPFSRTFEPKHQNYNQVSYFNLSQI